jgi:hypothetical protein
MAMTVALFKTVKISHSAFGGQLMKNWAYGLGKDGWNVIGLCPVGGSAGSPKAQV